MVEKKGQTSAGDQSIYQPAGFYMLRAPVLSADTFLRIMTGKSGVNAQCEDLETQLADMRLQSYQVLEQVADDPVVEQALHVASADLLEGLARLQCGEASGRRVQRAYAGLLRYLIRMSTRPTPFGLFAGVAVSNLSEHTAARVGTPSITRMRTRPDMAWLLSVIQKIETESRLRPQLTVVANRAVYSTSTRLMLPSADVYGQGDTRSISIRATSVVRSVLEQAREPLPYSELRQHLLATFPSATAQKIDALLQQLWENHFLMSDLRPPLTSADPEAFLLAGLRKIPAALTFQQTLDEVMQRAAAIDQVGVGGPRASFEALEERQKELLPDYTGKCYQVDGALRLENPHLNQEVGEAVADAAEALLHLTPAPEGPHHLREYGQAFGERYGIDAEVPLLDLLNPETGLDAPTGYSEPPRSSLLPPFPRPAMRQRDRLLCAWLVEAAHTRAYEVELTESRLKQVAQWIPTEENPPPATLEMYLQIQARSAEAIDRGEWRGVVAPMGLTYGGRTFCRFFDVLNEAGLTQLQAYARREEELFPEAIFAELSYLPTLGRGANVAIRPALRSYEIVVNTTPSVAPEKVIELHDLVVGRKHNRFYVRSLRLGKEVVVTQSHMLNPMRAPNVCRFLLEVSQDGRPALAPFDWGAASSAPFLPRVVWKKMVFSPAQWNMHRSTIEPMGAGSEATRFLAGVQAWRAQWQVPRYVYLAQFDQRLLLDLEHPLTVAELSHHLKQLGEDQLLKLQEMFPDFEHLWLKDQQGAPFVSELVVPLLLQRQSQQETRQETGTRMKQPEQAQVFIPRRHPISGRERRKLPGDEWTYLKLYAAPKQHDELITHALREGVRRMHEQQLIDRWFFLRYADPEPHLRVRFHAARAECKETVLTTALAWSREVADYGLLSNVIVDSYDREVERYGGPQAIDALEEVFSVNSSALSEIIAALYKQQITLDPRAVAVFSLDQLFEMWGLDVATRLEHLRARVGTYDAREAFRSQRKLLCQLLLPWDTGSDPEVRNQREQLLRLSSMQATVLPRVATQIRSLALQGELWGSERGILVSLAHMHMNRLLGTDRALEMQVYAFWRHTLESLARRPEGTKADLERINEPR